MYKIPSCPLCGSKCIEEGTIYKPNIGIVSCTNAYCIYDHIKITKHLYISTAIAFYENEKNNIIMPEGVCKNESNG